jgi:hypothetical protein
MGGYNNALDKVYQGYIIPSGATQATLTFWWYMTSSDSTVTPYDYLEVVLQSPPGNDLTGRFQISNTAQRGVWRQETINIGSLGSWAGYPMWWSFEVRTDGSALTTFFVDDISYVIQCGGAGGSGTGPFTSVLPTPTP